MDARWQGANHPRDEDLSISRPFDVDPAKYRSRDEVQAVRDKSDPIEGLKKELEEGGATEDQLKAIDKEIRGIVSEAADFAEQSPEPELGELYTDILVGTY